MFKSFTNETKNTYEFKSHKSYTLNQSSVTRHQFLSGSNHSTSASYYQFARINLYLSGSDYTVKNPLFNNVPTVGDKKQQSGIYLTKFYESGSICFVSQSQFNEGIKKGSFSLTDNSTAATIKIVDDKKGNLYSTNATFSQSVSALSSSDNYVGNIFYTLGIINITETGSFGPSAASADISYSNVGTGLDGGIGSGSYDIKFESSHTITSRLYNVKVSKGDFNYTNNLTARRFGTVSGSAASSSLMASPYLNNDILSGSLSGSWGPFMTTIGFYRKYPGTDMIDNHPVMIAKYPAPIMIPPDVDITFVIRIDF